MESFKPKIDNHLRVEVGYDQGDIRCTMVLLKAKNAAGALHTPLSVQLLPDELKDVAWEMEAKRYLDARLRARRDQIRQHPNDVKPIHFSQRNWENLADEFHWDGPATSNG